MIILNVIKLFAQDKSTYNKYTNILNSINLEPEIKDILTLISNYYIKYTEHTYISQDELIQFFHKEFAAKRDKDFYVQLIKQAYGLDTSDSLAADIMLQLVETDFANRIAQAVLPIVTGDSPGSLGSIRSLLDEYETAVGATEKESPFVDMDLDELLKLKQKDGILWRLHCLRTCLGPLTGGSLGHVFARPECGKTTFMHSEVSYMSQQLKDGETILWFNNEEAGNTVKLRFYSAVCGATYDEITRDKQRAKEVFNSNGGHRMKLYDCATISVSEIEAVCREYRPRIVIIDQGDKVSFKGSSKSGNKADTLKDVYDNLREVVKRCNKDWQIDMITVGQADAAADGAKWLTQNNLDSGKTGKPGAFDYILGIGFVYDAGQEFTRYLHPCKNKLTGDHGRYVVTIDPFRARYVD